MKKFLPLAALIVFILTILGAGLGLALVVRAPFSPGSTFFPLQHFAEEKRGLLIFNQTEKALYYFSLAERRITDLALASGTQREIPGLIALGDALDGAEAAQAAAPANDSDVLKLRMSAIIERTEAVMRGLSLAPLEAPETYALVQARVSTLRSLMLETKLSQNALQKARILLLFPMIASANDLPAGIGPDFMLDPHTVSFPPGSAGAEHAFFPLLGAHSTLACESCHVNGQFAGTAEACSACHSMDKPANHFTAECSSVP